MKTYITLLSNDEYFLYTVALWHSHKNVNSKYPLTIIITEKLSKHIISKMNLLGMNYMYVDTSDFDDIFNKSKISKNWKEAFRKLTVFKLTQFEKMIFLDCDTIMVKNMDHLFEYDTLTTTSRYNSKSKKIRTLLSGMFVFEPSLTDYNNILETISNVIDNKYSNKHLTINYANDEHILSEVFKGRMHKLDCVYQWMPHIFNRGTVLWKDIYLVHIGAPKRKWFSTTRFINNEVSKPFSEFDYSLIYWYFNRLDEVVILYNLPYNITTKTDIVDMTKFNNYPIDVSSVKRKKLF